MSSIRIKRSIASGPSPAPQPKSMTPSPPPAPPEWWECEHGDYRKTVLSVKEDISRVGRELRSGGRVDWVFDEDAPVGLLLELLTTRMRFANRQVLKGKEALRRAEAAYEDVYLSVEWSANGKKVLCRVWENNDWRQIGWLFVHEFQDGCDEVFDKFDEKHFAYLRKQLRK